MPLPLPDIATLTLEHGPFRAVLFDPRPDPMALGARYIHGGYVAAWYHGERCLTSRCRTNWETYDGQGLPEVFETAFPAGLVPSSEPIMRIGAGQVLAGEPGLQQAHQPLIAPVTWQVESQAANRIVMRCHDALTTASGQNYAYQLVRTIELTEQGLLSHSQLRIQCPWAVTLAWFPHPFFAHEDGTGTRYQLPAQSHALSGKFPALPIDAAGMVTAPVKGGLGVYTNVWRLPVTRFPIQLDARRGGGMVTLEVDYPVDKLVAFATQHAGSLEPYWARFWHNGESADWSVRYLWQEA
jgi:hypothetical protein